MANHHVYLNGRIVPAEEAAISVFDTGLLHGASVFTTLRAHHGTAFRLARHLARLLGTAERIALRHDTTAETLTAAVADLLAANELSEARIRITLTPGPVGAEPRPTTLVTAAPIGDQPRQWYEQGVAAIISPFRQPVGGPTAGAKTGCYLERILARQAAAAAGAEEALWFTPDGRLAEGCFANVFVVGDGTVRTPPADTPVLPGIVREAVLELCEKLSVPCGDAGPLTIKETLAADELFVTSSITGIRPVVRIERHAVADERPGPITKQLLAAYAELVDDECPPRP